MSLEGMNLFDDALEQYNELEAHSSKYYERRTYPGSEPSFPLTLQTTLPLCFQSTRSPIET